MTSLDEVSDPPSQRAQKSHLLVVFFIDSSDALWFLWISSARSSAGDSAVASVRGCVRADQDKADPSPPAHPIFLFKVLILESFFGWRLFWTCSRGGDACAHPWVIFADTSRAREGMLVLIPLDL